MKLKKEQKNLTWKRIKYKFYKDVTFRIKRRRMKTLEDKVNFFCDTVEAISNLSLKNFDIELDNLFGYRIVINNQMDEITFFNMYIVGDKQMLSGHVTFILSNLNSKNEGLVSFVQRLIKNERYENLILGINKIVIDLI